MRRRTSKNNFCKEIWNYWRDHDEGCGMTIRFDLVLRADAKMDNIWEASGAGHWEKRF